MVKRLGRGISALIPEFPEEMDLVYKVAEIEVARIRANPHQPRKEFHSEAMEELKQSIQQKGIIQPITVRQIDDGFELIAGERRLRACVELGLDTIPAYVLPVTSDVEMMELALIENVQRENLNPVEEAEAYAILANTFNLSHEEIARKVSKERSTVTNAIRLLNLPEAVLKDLRDGKLSAGHARPILSLGDESQRLHLWQRIRRDGMSVRAVEALVKKTSQKKSGPPKAAPAARSPYIRQLEEKLMHLMGTKVRIRGSEQKGSLEIEYYSMEDLSRIVEILEAGEESAT